MRQFSLFISCVILLYLNTAHAQQTQYNEMKSQASTSLCTRSFQTHDYEKAMILCLQTAEKGEPLAQFTLGQMYFTGLGVVPNNNEAFTWFNKAATQGHAPAQYYLGKMISGGLDGEENESHAAKWYIQSAKQGYAPAQFLLALSYALGIGVPQDDQLALKWYKEAADQKYANTRPIPDYALRAPQLFSLSPKQPEQQTYDTGLRLLLETDNPQVSEDAAKLLLKAAEAGHPDAAVYMGIFYKDGIGVLQSFDKSLFWFRQAAEKHHKTGELYLAWMTFHGFGLPSDENIAVDWFIKAYLDESKLAHVKPELTIPTLVKADLKPKVETLEWYLDAAKKNDPAAQYELGKRYLQGIGVQKNTLQGFYWLKHAANGNHREAQFQLAKLYQKGDGVVQNDFEALTYYKQAAQNGHATAQYELGLLYFKGIVVPQSFVHAYAWMNLAAANGNPKALTAKQVLKAKMSLQQIQQAQMLSQELFEKENQ